MTGHGMSRWEDIGHDEGTAMSSTTRFPFSAVVGQDDARLALLLAAVDPGIGGVLLRGDPGSAKSTMARALAGLLPGGAPFVELTAGATEAEVRGTLDVEAAGPDEDPPFRPGLLAAAHNGVLFVDDVNLLPDHLVRVVLDAAATGVNRVERAGRSHTHPARFVLVGAMDPADGELPTRLLDRFGLQVEVRPPSDPAQRAEVVRRRLTHDAGGDVEGTERDIVLRARLAASMPADLPDTVVDFACRLAVGVGADGLRADLVLCRAAAAHAGWQGRAVASTEDVERVAPLVLAHRRRRRPFDPPTLSAEELERALEAARQSFEEASPTSGGDTAAPTPPAEDAAPVRTGAGDPPAWATSWPSPPSTPGGTADAGTRSGGPRPAIWPSGLPATSDDDAPAGATGDGGDEATTGPQPPHWATAAAQWSAATGGGATPSRAARPAPEPGSEATAGAADDRVAAPTGAAPDGGRDGATGDGAGEEGDEGDPSRAAASASPAAGDAPGPSGDGAATGGAPASEPTAGTGTTTPVAGAADPDGGTAVEARAEASDGDGHPAAEADAASDDASPGAPGAGPGTDEGTTDGPAGTAGGAPGTGGPTAGDGGTETPAAPAASASDPAGPVAARTVEGSAPAEDDGTGTGDEAAREEDRGTPGARPGDDVAAGTAADLRDDLSDAPDPVADPPGDGNGAPGAAADPPGDGDGTGPASGSGTGGAPAPAPGVGPSPWQSLSGRPFGAPPPGTETGPAGGPWPAPRPAGAPDSRPGPGDAADAPEGPTGGVALLAPAAPAGPATAPATDPADPGAPPTPAAPTGPAAGTPPAPSAPGRPGTPAARGRTVGRTIVVAVDASGSGETHRRVEAAAGAVLGLLSDAYLRRERVALVSFRGGTAEVVLPPTASLELARTRLAELPTGGVAPLAEGIRAALSLARQAAADGHTPLVVLVTDGRATGSQNAQERALAAAGELATSGFESLVVDAGTGSTRGAEAADLATVLGTRCIRPAELSPQAVEATIRESLR